MTIESAKKTLQIKALHKHPGIMISYCGSKTNWNDCFTEVELNGKKELVFWYNLPNSGTCNEIMTIN